MTIDHEALRKLAGEATPGPWRLSADSETITQTSHITRDVWTIPRTHADMAFIAAASPAVVLGLLGELTRLGVSIHKAAAAARKAERADVVAHLRTGGPSANDYADDIERGAHEGAAEVEP